MIETARLLLSRPRAHGNVLTTIVGVRDGEDASSVYSKPWVVRDPPEAPVRREQKPVSQATDLLEADVATVTDDDVIEKLDAEQHTGSRQTRREFDVVARRCGITAYAERRIRQSIFWLAARRTITEWQATDHPAATVGKKCSALCWAEHKRGVTSTVSSVPRPTS